MTMGNKNNVLQWDCVSAGYSSVPVFQELKLSIGSGLTVVTGPNGSGKSTLLRSAAGIIAARQGRILLNGQDIRSFGRRALARQIAFLPQIREIPDMTVESLVLHGRYPHLSWDHRLRPQDRECAGQAMADMGIWEYRTRNLRMLSGGERQKAYLAMAIAQDTQWLLLDEPTTFLDIRQQFEILARICTFVHEGKNVVLILHDLPQALELEGDIVVLERGCVRFSGTADKLYESGLIQSVFGVLPYRFIASGHMAYHFRPLHGDEGMQ